MSGSMIEVIGSSSTPRMGRRSMALADIDPKYVSQSGIWEASEVETSRGSIRIQHLTTHHTSSVAGSRISSASIGSSSSSIRDGGILKGHGQGHGHGHGQGRGPSPARVGSSTFNPRFPRLEDCAHFHYDCVELPQLKIQIRDDPSKPISSHLDSPQDKCAFSIEVVAGTQSWAMRRTHKNLQMLDSQLHRCVWDRMTFSHLSDLSSTDADSKDDHNGCRDFITKYLDRLNSLPTNKITCGTVLSWFELDNRGRHIVSADTINTPAVAAACAVKKYVAQAADEISFEVGEMISLIDMPPPEESIWWRGKRGYQVGFFPREYVQVIGDKVPLALPTIVPSMGNKSQRLSLSSTSSSASSSSSSAPDKPVLRKHGKLIAFFRSFILNRPSRRRLKQSGILRERVFGCDLAEHLLNTGNEIPTVLNCCSQFIEKHGIIDGVYRLSGVTSNIQKLRNAFDEDKIPNLEGDLAIKQDIHAVSSLLKMYFRELPNPLCTYQLYDKFVAAAKDSDEERLFKMREVVHELPPPHYRTLQYLMGHLSKVAERSNDTGMTAKNMAIVWAPNLIRSKELEAGGVAALKGIGVQAVVTEYLIRHADLIFNDKLPPNFPTTTTVLNTQKLSGPGSRPKSLALCSSSTSPIKLMSLEEAQDKENDRKFIEVGGGPSNLPPKYHTVIELPSQRRGGGMGKKRSPIGWKQLFSRNRSFSKPQRKQFTPGDITVITRNMPVAGPQGMQTNWAGRLRPVKSVESLVSPPMYDIGNNTSSTNALDSQSQSDKTKEDSHNNAMDESESEPPGQVTMSSPASPITSDVHVMFHPPPMLSIDPRSLQSHKTHNRSISHDSYFEFGEFRNSNSVYIDETLEEEENMSQSSQSSGAGNSPVKGRAKSEEKEGPATARKDPFLSPVTPPPSAASVTIPCSDSYENALSNSEFQQWKNKGTVTTMASKWRDSEVQTSQLKLSDVGVSTEEDNCYTVSASAGASMEKETYSKTAATSTSTRNSSFDESSEMSTPEEPLPTNFIYSPLVNESSAASSSENFNLLRRSTASIASMQNKQSNRTSNNSFTDDAFNVANANVCLFVCPLYEAGIQAEQPAEISKPEEKAEHIYENEGKVKEEVTEAPSLIQPQVKEICHIYENERIYENQPIAPIRKRSPVPVQPTTTTTIEPTPTDTSDYLEPITVKDLPSSIPTSSPKSPIPKPKAREPLPSTCMGTGNGNYSEFSHYENVSESHEGNIYEDIEEDDKHNDNHEGKYSGGSGGSCRYEAVGPSSPPVPSSRKSLCKKVNRQNSSETSEDEYSANYESVKFQKVEGGLVAHHYSEIEEKAEQGSGTNSTGTNSRTEDIGNYLELQLQTLPENSPIEEGSYESVGGTGTASKTDGVLPPSPGDEEIHFIDSSPLLVENPVYSLEDSPANPQGKKMIETPEEDFDISMNESISISFSEEDKVSPITTSMKPLVGRCNSAPLADTKKDFSVNFILGEKEDENCDKLSSLEGTSTTTNPQKILHLCKRLSDPSLSFTNPKTDTANETAWKVADAKRLANRKSSVKELLSKFETRDSTTPSPTGTNAPLPLSQGPGLPRPSSQKGYPSGRKDFSSGKFQHHRFSMGDILLGQSIESDSSVAESSGKSSPSPKAVMVRSDTFPELRSTSLKIQASKENINEGTPLVPEKVQNAIRVAMSSVDMNDPSTRERIEKYKEERRSFLRQKITGDLSQPSSLTEFSSQETILNNTNGNDEPTTTRSNSTIVTMTFTSKTLQDSPRKRAFTEDSHSQVSSNNKSIRTAEPYLEESSSTITKSTMEEINVKEKIALWTMQKKEMSKSSEIIQPGHNSKGAVPASVSLGKPILRREVTTSSIEISKSKINANSTAANSANNSSGKKIKDMAAFFEAKRF